MKKMIPFSVALFFLFGFVSHKNSRQHTGTHSSFTIHHLPSDTILYPDEKHLKNVRQLTFGGDNAEAYWSFDSKSIIFQRTQSKEGLMCDQIFIGKIPKK